jgi:hypothetical protein
MDSGSIRERAAEGLNHRGKKSNESEDCVGTPSRSSEIIERQLHKLHEMRKSQIMFFEHKMVELRQKEVTVRGEINRQESLMASLRSKELQIANASERLRLERQEITAIKNLLKAEIESIDIQSRDLRRLILKYEDLTRANPSIPHIVSSRPL